MPIEYFQQYCKYNYALHRRLWDCIEQISNEQFVEEVSYSIGSIRNHMVHLASVDARWLSRLTGSQLPDGLEYTDFPTKVTARAIWEQSAHAMLNYVEALQDSQLDDIVSYDIPARGGLKHNSRWQILLHVVNHGTDHRAQILSLLHHFRGPTLEQDFMIYLWD